MKILHTADLHLDSPFSSSGVFTAEHRRQEQRDTFVRIFDLARTEGCDMILIAGDLFDVRYITPETRELVRSVFSETKIPIIIAPGNHDPYVSGSFYRENPFPDNVYIFSSSELQRFDFPELHVSVYGYGFTSPTLSESPLCNCSNMAEDGNIRLLCAHADLASPISRYCPLTVGDIAALGVDYAALGHIHNRDTDDSFGGSTILYSGFAEGRSFDELGDGCVIIAHIDEEHRVSVSRKVVSAHRFEIRELDISPYSEKSEIICAIKAEAESASAGKPTHLRLVLSGTADASDMPDLGVLRSELTGGELLSVEFSDTTIPTADIASLNSDPSLRGEFYRALYSGLIDSDPDKRRKYALALQIGLSAIEGRKIAEGVDEL